MRTDLDLKNDDTSVNMPELFLGLGLVGLGTYFIFRSASRLHRLGILSAHHVPTDITFTPGLPPSYTGTVTMCSDCLTGPTTLIIAYNPPSSVTPQSDQFCTVSAGNATGQFQFTVKAGQTCSTVTASFKNSDHSISSITAPL